MACCFFLATTINYVDRQILALVKPILDEQLHWTNAEYGQVNSAFQAAYAVGLLLFGALVDRVGTKVGYALSIAAWSLSAMGHALVGSVTGFFGARVALGVSEGGNFPSAIKAVALWFPRRERALATALFNSGANVGAVVAPAMVPAIALAWGWHAAFVIAGCVGLAWLVLWIPFYDVPEKIRRVTSFELAHIRSDADEQAGNAGGAPVGWLEHPPAPAGVVVHRRQVPDRSGLVVLPHLAAGLLQEDARARHQGEPAPPRLDLRHRRPC